MAKAKTTKPTPIKGKTPVSKKAIRQAVQRGDQAPDTKATTKEASAAAAKLFADADQAALAGYPPDLTVEQHDNLQRRKALGY